MKGNDKQRKGNRKLRIGSVERRAENGEPELALRVHRQKSGRRKG